MRTAPTEEDLISRHVYYHPCQFTRPRLASMCEQVVQVLNLAPRRVLEVGPGAGIVSRLLRETGIEVVTLDVNSNLDPDIVGDVMNLTEYVDDNGFDCVLCAEVLEHLPLFVFKKCLQNIATVASESAVISLPTASRFPLRFQYNIRIAKLVEKLGSIQIACGTSPLFPGHHWELGSSRETSVRSIRKQMREFFSEVIDFSFPLHPRHHFFVLRK